MNSEAKNLFLAILISVAFIYGYNKFFVEPKLKRQQELKKIEQSLRNEGTPTASTSPLDANSSASPKVDGGIAAQPLKTDTPVVFVNRDEEIAKDYAANTRLKISTEKLHGSINLQGASFDDLTLAEYKETMAKDSKEVVLLSPKDTNHVHFVESGWISNNKSLKLPNKDSVWVADKTELTTASPVTLTWNNGEGLVFKKTISVDDKFMFNIADSVTNNTAEEIQLSPFSLINRSKEAHKESYVSHEGPVAYIDNKLTLKTYDEIFEEKKVDFKTKNGWVAIGDKYWLSAIAPANREAEDSISFKSYEKDGLKRFQVDVLSSSVKVPAGGTIDNVNNIYLGAKKVKFLDEYAEKLKLPLFDRTVDFGSLYFLTKPMFEVLHFSYEKIGNFGIAIIILTFIVRMFLFPLANMSYKSMAKMKIHMPEINRIREKHSKDKQKQGMELMKFYKEQKVNPASGCLPLLIQIPVFFALYKVLYVTIEMRHAPFYLWIHDLSDKDPTNIFNLFGLLTYTPPSWLPAIGVLPLLYTITMVLQQKLNPPATDPTQEIVIKWMPWIFLFIFASFPAGLVLYWVCSNILSIIQQYVITKRIEHQK